MEVSPGTEISLGADVIFTCLSEGATEFRLKQDGRVKMYGKVKDNNLERNRRNLTNVSNPVFEMEDNTHVCSEMMFTIRNFSNEDQGIYSCESVGANRNDVTVSEFIDVTLEGKVLSNSGLVYLDTIINWLSAKNETF